jgi:hypothetical protein
MNLGQAWAITYRTGTSIFHLKITMLIVEPSIPHFSQTDYT